MLQTDYLQIQNNDYCSCKKCPCCGKTIRNGFTPNIFPSNPFGGTISGNGFKKEVCAKEEFFKAHPDASSCLLVCHCSKCSVRC